MKDDDSNVLDQSAVDLISNFLQVSIAIYQADLYFLTIPLLVNAIQRACASEKTFRISSEPPAATTGPRPARKRYGDSAIYEILESKSFLLRCIVELRTEQAACPLKSVLLEAHHAMLYRKASTAMLVIGVSTQCLSIKTAQVHLDEEETLQIDKYVEFTLTNRRTLDIDRSEAAQFVWQLSQWLVEFEHK